MRPGTRDETRRLSRPLSDGRVFIAGHPTRARLALAAAPLAGSDAGRDGLGVPAGPANLYARAVGAERPAEIGPRQRGGIRCLRTIARAGGRRTHRPTR